MAGFVAAQRRFPGGGVLGLLVASHYWLYKGIFMGDVDATLTWKSICSDIELYNKYIQIHWPVFTPKKNLLTQAGTWNILPFYVPSLQLTVCTWKWVSFWDGATNQPPSPRIPSVLWDAFNTITLKGHDGHGDGASGFILACFFRKPKMFMKNEGICWYKDQLMIYKLIPINRYNFDPKL